MDNSLFTRITNRDLRTRMNLARTTRYSRVNARDTRFVPEVQPITKVAYVSVEVPMKDQVSLDDKPPRTITKINFGSSLSNPHEREGKTNFSELTLTLVAPRGHLVHLGDDSPRVTNTRRLLVKCPYLNIKCVTQDLAQISPRRLGFD
jgi:hypothetical protein